MSDLRITPLMGTRHPDLDDPPVKVRISGHVAKELQSLPPTLACLPTRLTYNDETSMALTAVHTPCPIVSMARFFSFSHDLFGDSTCTVAQFPLHRGAGFAIKTAWHSKIILQRRDSFREMPGFPYHLTTCLWVFLSSLLALFATFIASRRIFENSGICFDLHFRSQEKYFNYKHKHGLFNGKWKRWQNWIATLKVIC